MTCRLDRRSPSFALACVRSNTTDNPTKSQLEFMQRKGDGGNQVPKPSDAKLRPVKEVELFFSGLEWAKHERNLDKSARARVQHYIMGCVTDRTECRAVLSGVELEFRFGRASGMPRTERMDVGEGCGLVAWGGGLPWHVTVARCVAVNRGRSGAEEPECGVLPRGSRRSAQGCGARDACASCWNSSSH